MNKNKQMVILCLLLAANYSPVFAGEWTANVVQNLKALVTSCVVVPCTFTHPQDELPSSKLRGIWHLSDKSNERIYFEDQTQVLENFRGRTRLLGELGRNNCTLEITDIKDHDNGPFCFRLELAQSPTDPSTTDKFSFVNNCVKLNMHSDFDKISVTHSETAIEGHPFTITCAVKHSCPSYPPVITWSRGTTHDIIASSKDLDSGYKEVVSILTFIPAEKDDHSEVTCTAAFKGGRMVSSSVKVFVKRTENYNHIIIPAVVGISTAAIFGVLCIFMVKKYKRRITELQHQDGSMWNRLSRMSHRFRSNGPGPSRSDQRPNNMCSRSCANQKISKPRFPSPKSQPKSKSIQPKSYNYKEDVDDADDYVNSADLNVYGNL